jgi:hypothetical protein
MVDTSASDTAQTTIETAQFAAAGESLEAAFVATATDNAESDEV